MCKRWRGPPSTEWRNSETPSITTRVDDVAPLAANLWLATAAWRSPRRQSPSTIWQLSRDLLCQRSTTSRDALCVRTIANLVGGCYLAG